jgi:hypothetical protein
MHAALAVMLRLDPRGLPMDIQPADPGQRRRVAIALFSAVSGLLAIVVAFELWLQHVSAQLDTPSLIAKLKPTLAVCLALIAVCITALGVHLIVRGKRIVEDRRFPARDTRTIRDTPVREGNDAARIGFTSQIGGLILCVLALAVTLLGWIWIHGIG